jgi:phospholipase C
MSIKTKPNLDFEQTTKILTVLLLVSLAACTKESTKKRSIKSFNKQVQPANPALVDTTRYPRATPIKHLVIIFNENISFDHYFGAYPLAANTNGIPWQAKSNTPTVNGLNYAMLHNNPNKYNPKRLGPSEAYTCDNDHGYSAEQKAFNGG